MTLLNKQIGYLKVLSLVSYNTQKGYTWRCGCWCGNYVEMIQRDLLRQNKRRQKTCGNCHLDDRFKKEYLAYQGMINRCTYPSHKHWDNYGGRGITICSRWANSFRNFLLDMNLAPSIYHTMDRIDNNGNYEPGNCCWSTKAAQLVNRRNTLSLTRFVYDLQYNRGDR